MILVFGDRLKKPTYYSRNDYFKKRNMQIRLNIQFGVCIVSTTDSVHFKFSVSFLFLTWF